MLRVYSVLITLLSLMLLGAYFVRPNWAAALTIFPAWAWLWVWLLALPFCKRRVFAWISVVWLVFIIFQLEEPRSLFRGWTVSGDIADHDFAAVTINCLGKTESLQTGLDEGASVLFIQESPSFELLSKFCENQGLELLYGLDTSLAVRGGSLTGVRSALHFNTGVWEIQGRQITLCSVRLTTTPPRIDLWSPRCWKEQAKIKKWQRRLMRTVIDSLPANGQVMVGGDINVPQGDKVYSLFGRKFRDSF